jgi:N6-L-threonylcarbamoyladenine synthase
MANMLLDPQPQFPMLGLIVSGGHTQIVLFNNHFDYELLGQTQDDAVGEAFDKVAKIIGLPYPGGPSIQKAAESGNEFAFEFPKARSRVAKTTNSSRAGGADEKRTEAYKSYAQGASEPATKRSAESTNSMDGSADQQVRAFSGLGPYDFSFSGLKTAVLRRVQQICGKDYTFPSFELAALLDEEQVNDLAASFQRVAIETLVDKTAQAYEEFKPVSVVIGGGVAANTELRRQLQASLPLEIRYIPMDLCTDNAAMIATLGYYQAQKHEADDAMTLAIEPNLKM